MKLDARHAACAALVAVGLVPAPAAGADDATRAVKTAVFEGTSLTVVVAEGELEPRSVGSYSVRIYGGTNPAFPYDDFVAGAIRHRDGAVERVALADLNGDGSSEIVVVIRSVGTGGFLSADAFVLRDRALTLLGSVSDLAKDADPVAALAATIGPRASDRLAPGTEDVLR